MAAGADHTSSLASSPAPSAATAPFPSDFIIPGEEDEFDLQMEAHFRTLLRRSCCAAKTGLFGAACLLFTALARATHWPEIFSHLPLCSV